MGGLGCAGRALPGLGEAAHSDSSPLRRAHSESPAPPCGQKPRPASPRAPGHPRLPRSHPTASSVRASSGPFSSSGTVSAPHLLFTQTQPQALLSVPEEARLLGDRHSLPQARPHLWRQVVSGIRVGRLRSTGTPGTTGPHASPPAISKCQRGPQVLGGRIKAPHT